MLSGLRRSLVISLPKNTKLGLANKNTMKIMTRSMVDLSKKEQGKETIYQAFGDANHGDDIVHIPQVGLQVCY
jgi:regulator of replication initiation timing